MGLLTGMINDGVIIHCRPAREALQHPHLCDIQCTGDGQCVLTAVKTDAHNLLASEEALYPSASVSAARTHPRFQLPTHQDADEAFVELLGALRPTFAFLVNPRATCRSCGTVTEHATYTTCFVTVDTAAASSAAAFHQALNGEGRMMCATCNMHSVHDLEETAVQAPPILDVRAAKTHDHCPISRSINLPLPAGTVRYNLSSSRHYMGDGASGHWFSVSWKDGEPVIFNDTSVVPASEGDLDFLDETWQALWYIQSSDEMVEAETSTPCPPPSTQLVPIDPVPSSSVPAPTIAPVGTGTYACRYCDYVAANLTWRTRHERRCGGNPKRITGGPTGVDRGATGNELLCPEPGCGQILNGQWSAAEHAYAHTCGSKSQFACRLGCHGLWFRSAAPRSTHYKKHHGIFWPEALKATKLNKTYEGRLIAHDGVVQSPTQVDKLYRPYVASASSTTSQPAPNVPQPSSLPLPVLPIPRAPFKPSHVSVVKAAVTPTSDSIATTSPAQLAACQACADINDTLLLAKHYRVCHGDLLRQDGGQGMLDWDRVGEADFLPDFYDCSHNECPRRFTSASDLQIHERTHESANGWQCYRGPCRRSFKTKAGLRSHMITDHTHGYTNPRFPHRLVACPVDWCGEVFGENSKLQRHLIGTAHLVHAHEPTPYITRDPAHWQRLERSGTPIFTAAQNRATVGPKGFQADIAFVCGLCARASFSKDIHEGHLVTHLLGETWFCLYGCNVAYAHKGRRTDHHMAKHGGEQAGAAILHPSLQATGLSGNGWRGNLGNLPQARITFWRPTPETTTTAPGTAKQQRKNRKRKVGVLDDSDV